MLGNAEYIFLSISVIFLEMEEIYTLTLGLVYFIRRMEASYLSTISVMKAQMLILLQCYIAKTMYLPKHYCLIFFYESLRVCF